MEQLEMRKIRFFITLLVLNINFMECFATESIDRAKSLYFGGFYEESFNQISGITGPLTKEPLWLLAEMYYLGRGTKVDLSLAYEFMKKSLLSPAPSSSYLEPPRLSNSSIQISSSKFPSIFLSCHQSRGFRINSSYPFEPYLVSRGPCSCSLLPSQPLDLLLYLTGVSQP